jgi:hypothetical protein
VDSPNSSRAFNKSTVRFTKSPGRKPLVSLSGPGVGCRLGHSPDRPFHIPSLHHPTLLFTEKRAHNTGCTLPHPSLRCHTRASPSSSLLHRCDCLYHTRLPFLSSRINAAVSLRIRFRGVNHHLSCFLIATCQRSVDIRAVINTCHRSGDIRPDIAERPL